MIRTTEASTALSLYQTAEVKRERAAVGNAERARRRAGAAPRKNCAARAAPSRRQPLPGRGADRPTAHTCRGTCARIQESAPAACALDIGRRPAGLYLPGATRSSITTRLRTLSLPPRPPPVALADQ